MDWKFSWRIYRRWITFVFVVVAAALSAGCVGGTTVWENRVRFLRESTGQLTVKPGSVVELPCLAVDGTSNSSGRRLSVRWMRDGVLADDLTPRPNGSLILRNVQLEQEAIYQCAVLSTRYGVALSQRANLTVSKITNFTAEPQDVTASIGSSVRFQCIAAATCAPSVSFTWFHNQLPLANDDDRRFRILASGILQIVDVRESDGGSYHCVASNVAGNITSRAARLNTTTSKGNQHALLPGRQHISQLRVLKAPDNISVSEGETALFECLFDDDDGIEVVWKKIDGSAIPSKAYQIGSNLLIKEVTNGDDGVYACVGSDASGKLLSVTLTANLTLDSPPEIRKFPEEKLSRRGEWWRFHCDTAAEPVPEIVWYKNGEQLKSRGRIKIFPNEDQPPARLEKPSGEVNFGRDLLVSSIQAEDVGIYQCFASNYLGTTSAAATLGYLDVDLEGPTNLTASVGSNQREIMLTWRPPPRNDEEYRLTVYIVHFHESEAGSENTVAVQQDACYDGVCRTVCCSNVDLVPHTNYTFWVDALVVYQDEPLFTRNTESIVLTSGDAVSLAVAPVLIRELPDASQVQLSWSAPPIDELRGQVYEYRVEVKEKISADHHDDDNGGGDEFEEKPAEFLPPDKREHAINGLPLGGVVYFRVLPRTRAGFPDKLPEKTYPWLRYKVRASNRTVSAPAAAPYLDARSVNSTSVLVQWVPATNSDKTLRNVSKWLISGYRPGDGVRLLRSEVSGNLNSAVLLGLESDTLYQLSVAAVGANGAEGLSAIRLVKTSAVVSPPAVSLPVASEPIIPFPTPACQVIGPGKLKVHWTTPPMNIVKFAVRYSLLPEDNNEPLNVSAYVKRIETSENFILFTDLSPGRNYLFAIRAENTDGYKSSFSDDISCYLPMTKPLPPGNVHISIVNGTSLFIIWTGSPIADGMGDITLYRVRYSTTLTDPDSWKEIIVNGSSNSVYLSGLNSTFVYFVSVSAENEAGRSEESRVQAVQVGMGMSGGATMMNNNYNNDNNQTTVVFRTSYKEGIIIGACIAVACAIACAVVIIFRTKRGDNRHFCSHCFPSRRHSTTNKSPTTHLGNGQCKNSERRMELAEIQTLLPRLIENADSDAKGGTNLCGPKGCPVSRANFSLQHGAAASNSRAFVATESSQPPNELLTVLVQSPCTTEGEQSSDLSSRSPVTASSVGSWGAHHHPHHHRRANGVGGAAVNNNNNSSLLRLQGRRNHHGSISMPNLFDSGIGFEDSLASTTVAPVIHNGGGQYHHRRQNHNHDHHDRLFDYDGITSISRGSPPLNHHSADEDSPVGGGAGGGGSVGDDGPCCSASDDNAYHHRDRDHWWSKMKNGGGRRIIRLRDLLATNNNGRRRRQQQNLVDDGSGGGVGREMIQVVSKPTDWSSSNGSRAISNCT